MKRQATDWDKDGKKLNLSALLTEITVTQEESDNLFKNEHIFIIWPSNHAPGHLCQRNKLCSHKNPDVGVQGSFIWSTQKLETNIMPPKREQVSKLGPTSTPQNITQYWKGIAYWYIQEFNQSHTMPPDVKSWLTGKES